MVAGCDFARSVQGLARAFSGLGLGSRFRNLNVYLYSNMQSFPKTNKITYLLKDIEKLHSKKSELIKNELWPHSSLKLE